MISLSLASHQYKALLIISSAFFMDIILGDPAYRFHPVRIIGKLIEFFYKLLKHIRINKRFLGIIIVIFVLFLSLFFYLLFYYLLKPYNILLDIFLCYSFIAFKDLFDHVYPIVKCLDRNDIIMARTYLSKVVGRDTKRLNKEGIIRATIETIAEGFVDGFLSPIFWFIIGSIFGWPVAFMLVYKVINTLDSMIGYKSLEFREIGYASARLDDIVNFIPARVSIIILFIASLFCGLDAKKGIFIAMRDRLKHESPNSGHPEAFVAGAVGIRLGGPTYYHYGLIKKEWIGEGTKVPEVSDILVTIRLIKVSAFVSMFFYVFFLLLSS